VGGPLNLSGGLNVSGVGAVNLGASGSLTSQDSFSGIGGGSLVTANQYVGYSGTGSFTQSGGASSISKYLYLGYSSSGSGNYNLSGGSLLAPMQYIGYSGSGGFTQSGGTNTPGYSSMYLGYNSGSSGSYSLSQSGLLLANNQYVGYGGRGSFTQSGGTNSPSNYFGGTSLYLGYNSSSSGTYSLSGGSLDASIQYIGYSGTGSFTQSGGTNSGARFLYLGYYAGSSGTYSLSGSGQLSAAGEYVGIGYASGMTAWFRQSGGINSTAFVLAGSGGGYLLTGGTLAASNGFAGTLDGGNSPATISVAGPAIVDLSQGMIANTASTSLAIGANSLTIVPPGMNPATLFGRYSNAGILHTAGTVLSVSAGQSFGGTGTIADPVNCQGSIVAVGGPICLSGGLNIAGTGNVDFSPSGGTLVTENSTSGISAGSLITSYQYVGYNGTGGFNQTGGTNRLLNIYYYQYNSESGLFLGFNTGSRGNYNLSGGSLCAPSQYIGYSGTGSFTQTGGTNSANTYLYLGYNGGSSGNYNLSGGSLYAWYVGLGNGGSGTGSFTQSGGTFSAGSIYLAEYGSGTYALTGGSLCSMNLSVGYQGNASFAQSGGTNSVSGALNVGRYSGTSSYTLSGSAQLVASSESIGSTDLFQQSSGINSTTFLSNGGRYLITGGTLLVSNGLSSGGTLDGGNGRGVINVAGPAIVSFFNQSQIMNGASTSFSIGANSLLIVPPGMNPATLFGSYSNAGIVHTAGSVLNVPAGQGFGGTGFILDPVNCQGSITAVGGQIYLDGGLNISGTASVDLGANSGTLDTNDNFSGITGGSLATAYQILGNNGSNSFMQTGGTNSISSSLYVSHSSTGSSNYNLSGLGVLVATSQFIGDTGMGSFTQSGGTNLAGFIYLGNVSGGSGSYNLSGSGQLTAASEYVGYRAGATALFRQSGGNNTTSFLSFGTGGRYLLTGGTLTAINGFVSAGTLDGGNSPATTRVAGPAIVDFSQGTIMNAASTSLSIGANSLLIVPPGMNPAALFGPFSNAGMVHTAGTTLSVPAGQGFGGTGTITDPINCQGTITALGGQVNTAGGLNISGTGTVNLGASSGTLITNDGFSGIAGGSLVTAYQIVGYSGTGSFTQSGGMNSVTNSLFLGYNNYGKGGTYTQSGGTNLVGSLYLGLDPGGSSNYNLSGTAVLTANLEYVGYQAAGVFTQSGGTNAISNGLNLSDYYPYGTGSYYLNSGLLALGGSGVTVGSGTAAFYFSSGTVQAGSSWSTTIPVTFPASGSVGTFDTNGHTFALNGPLTGAGGLVATGGGKLVLGGSNNYRGPTSVVSGTLFVANASALPDGADLIVGDVRPFTPSESSWVAPVSGNWSDASKWTDGVPNSAQTTAVFAAATTVAVSIALDEPATLRSLQLGNAGAASTGYTLSGSGGNTLTVNNFGGGATIVVADGTHAVDAPVVLDDNLEVTSGGMKSWTVSFGTGSSITDNGAGYSLTMNGNGGRLILGGTGSYTGGTIVEAGTLIATDSQAIADGTNLTVGNAGAFPAAIVDGGEVPVGSLATAVPEPGSVAMMVVLVAGLAGRWWLRRIVRFNSFGANF
jgi:hypothetical protein